MSTILIIVAAFLIVCGICIAISCKHALVVDDDYEEEDADCVEERADDKK